MVKHPNAQSTPRSNSQPVLPRGHFNSDGQSQGKQQGAVRPTADAHNQNTSQKGK